MKLVKVMGGTCSNNSMLSTYSVHFNDQVAHRPGPIRVKPVHFKFITESFFHWVRVKEDEYLLKPGSGD